MSWPVVALAHVTDVITKGTTPTSIGYNFADSGVPFLRAQNLQGGRVSLGEDALFVSDDTHAALARSQIRPDDILISIAGTIGRTALVQSGLGPLNCNQAVAIVRAKPELVHPPFLRDWLSTWEAQKQITGAKVTATISNLSLGEIGKLRFPLPPLAEQRRIADILDKAHAIRRKRKEAIALTEELLRSAFLEMFGDPVTNPKGWPVKALGELIDQSRGISYGVVQRGGEVENGVPVVRISNFGDNRFDGSRIVRTSTEISSAYRRTVLCGGELVVSIRGTVGRVAVVPQFARGWNVSREVAVIPLLEAVSRSLVHRALLSEGVQRFILGNVKGVAQSGINLSDLRQAPIPCPPQSRIAQFEQLANTVATTEASLVSGEEHASRLFESLVSSAFSQGRFA